MSKVVNLEMIAEAVSQETAERDWLSIIAERGALPRRDALLAGAQACGYVAAVDASAWQVEPDFSWLPYGEAQERRILVGSGVDRKPVAILGRPLDSSANERLVNSGVPFHRIFLADPLELRVRLEHYEVAMSAVAAAVAGRDDAEPDIELRTDLTLVSIQEESSPAIKLISSTVFDAIRFDASDVHLESVPKGMVVKFRIDGVLVNIAALNSVSLAEQAIARVKVLAELDIGERRVPQDGRFRVSAKGRDIDIRVSIMPSIHGEDAVLRILDKKALIDSVQKLTLDTLGFDVETIGAIRKIAAEPYGMLLVTGPTGSGKTTTLYAAISEINRGDDKFITIEDPVEYQLPGVLQIPVNEKKGLTFAVGLRSILRHDPDKILVGEIRDQETAQIAVQSALTGHMVFTSVHANNAFDVIGRFLHMGVDPYNFVSSLSGVVAQRLIRQICTNCMKPVSLGADELEELGDFDQGDRRFFIGEGCQICRGTGYKGRSAIAEVLKITDELREMIIDRASIRSLKAKAREDGMRTMREAAAKMVLDGRTTIQEINRVTFAD